MLSQKDLVRKSLFLPLISLTLQIILKNTFYQFQKNSRAFSSPLMLDLQLPEIFPRERIESLFLKVSFFEMEVMGQKVD